MARDRSTCNYFRVLKMDGTEIPKHIYFKNRVIGSKYNLEIWSNDTKGLQKTLQVDDKFFDKLEELEVIQYMTDEEFNDFYVEYTEVPISRLADID